MTEARATEVVHGWGRINPVDMSILELESAKATAHAVRRFQAVIPRGLGRSYGDAAQLGGSAALSCLRLDGYQWIDRRGGVIRARAGTSLGRIISDLAPAGWFVPVSPGTRHVTIGGAIAADIHGKNHHVDGSFGDHVRQLRIVVATGEVVTASRTENAELFRATLGGLGLTGSIIDADVVLAPIGSTRVRVETTRTRDLDHTMALMRASDDAHRFSVAWIDLLADGRGVLTQGRFASASELEKPRAAFSAPPERQVALPPLPLPRVVRPATVAAFNALWWRRAPSTTGVTYETITGFFHPLDAIADWPRLYGRAGFVQWQIAMPHQAESEFIDICHHFESVGAPAFFAVLKRFGPGNDAPLSFPIPGWTLALDLPYSANTLGLLDELDARVAHAGGRVYLAKDARMRPEHLARMYPRLSEWQGIVQRWNPDGRFQSDLSNRLALHVARR